jgi:hypothetical protein
MKIDSGAFLPKARSEGIITKDIDGELLIYDRTRDRAHCLNETAGAVWKLCDGRRSVAEIAGQLQPKEDSRQRTEASRQKAESFKPPPVFEHVVWLALDKLQRSYLLEAPKPELPHKSFWPPAVAGITNMSRREAVRRFGLGAAIALPIVISMTAPTPAEAAVSCGATCHPCSSPIDCCGVCLTGVPGCPGAGFKCT